MIFDSEFKKALQLLPSNEKDKLILRLLKRNLPLAKRMHFEMVDTESVEDKREQTKAIVVNLIHKATDQYYSPGYLLMDIRQISGVINEHVAITKDKLGEITLNCFMLRRLLELNNNRIGYEKPNKAATFCNYLIARVFKLLILIQKQHDDFHLEFQEDIIAIGEFIGKNDNLMKTAIFIGLDVNWLIHFNTPKNIADIYKNLRENRF